MYTSYLYIFMYAYIYIYLKTLYLNLNINVRPSMARRIVVRQIRTTVLTDLWALAEKGETKKSPKGG